jgi:hypothetical protein
MWVAEGWIGTNEKSATIQPHSSPPTGEVKGADSLSDLLWVQRKRQKCGQEMGWMEWLERMNIAWMEWMEWMNIAWMNGTDEYSVNEWSEWIFHEWMERVNIPWTNGTNEYSVNVGSGWIFHEWMERMNSPWMNGADEYSMNEYSVNEWNDWIFHEWIFREWIFLVLGGLCQVQTQNVLRLSLWAHWISSLFFAVSLSLALSFCGLGTQQLEIAKSVAAFKLFCEGGENQ